MSLRQLTYSLITITAIFLLGGCSDDPFNKYSSLTDNGMVNMRIQLTTSSESSVITRATNPSGSEKELTNAVVMVFDKNADNGMLRQVPVNAVINGGSDLTLTARLVPETSCYLCVVANISTSQIQELCALQAGKSLSDIRVILKADVSKSDASIGIFKPLPMSGWSEQTAISTITTSPTIPLSRSVARIDVNGISANPANPANPTADAFQISGIRLANGAPSGYVLQQPSLPFWGATDVVTYTLAETSATTPAESVKLEGAVYCFENKGAVGDTPNATRVVIRGHRSGISTDTWYPIDIVYDQPLTSGSISSTKKCYDIERNKIYTIRLNRVEKEGYHTYEEAAKSEAFNTMVDAEITVTDPYAYDIVTNGRQYMGVTNAEFVVYPAESGKAISNLHITTLSYTSDPNWTNGSITCSQGISLSAGSYPLLDVRGDANPTYRDIVVNIDPTISTNGLVTIQIGNLMKEIKVRVKETTPKVGTILNNYFEATDETTDFKVGEIISPSEDTSWLKVSTSDEDTGNSSLNNKITNPAGGIYLHVEPNIGFDTQMTTREASAYIAGDKDNQRIKIVVQQVGYDVYSGKQQLEPFTYVGTFHRWNQMGERLIRIDASNTKIEAKNGSSSDYYIKVTWWEATVVAGREFIVLDTKQSPDTKVHIYKNNDNNTPNAYGVGDDDAGFITTDEEVESYPVESKLRTVKGTGSYIYFRVGLTGKLSSATSQPRYGLITISYGTTAGVTLGTHNIYVRQGEAPDYLMRPWDASTTPINEKTGVISRANEFTSGTRPKAAKFGVYNLTDPDPEETVNSKGYVNCGTRGYTFTQYPSQGGYFFPASGTLAVDPRIGKQDLKLASNSDVPTFGAYNPWTDDWESCPKGYRRPSDGVTRQVYTGEGNKDKYPDDIINSEVRQSLWLFPLHGAERSDFSNQLTGYIADGYFDRHEIKVVEDNTETPKPLGIVNKGAFGAAYRGYLIFNPHNYASIFLPFAGFYREVVGPGCGYFGSEGYFNTRTTQPGNSSWLVAFGYIFPGQGRNGYVFDSYSSTSMAAAHSIRCIKDELPPAITDNTGITPPTENTDNLLVTNFSYDSEKMTLQASVEAKFNGSTDELKMQRINTIAINIVHELTTADYVFLNQWADGTGSYAGYHLRHIIIRGTGYNTLPTNAFTSSGWYSISLIDTEYITDNALTSGLTGLLNLSLPYLDTIKASSNAFSFDTSKVQVHLRGNDYSIADKTNNKWKDKSWKTIKQY